MQKKETISEISSPNITSNDSPVAKPAPKKKLAAFVVKERTPSPPPQRRPAVQRKTLNTNAIFNIQEEEKKEVV